MPDNLTPSQRSACMAAIRGKNTQPEMFVRRVCHRLGYRYRLHIRSIPGKPDLVFSRHNKLIFVHGCFWHRHRCKKGQSMPATRKVFWRKKLEDNRERDRSTCRKLRRLGWNVLVVWECQIKRKPDWVIDRVINFLESQSNNNF